MKTRVSTLLKDNLRDLVKTFRIPIDLHPRFPDPALTMHHLPDDAIERFCARVICLCEMREEVLVRSGLSSVWLNKKCDPVFRKKADDSEMSIYDFMTLPSWGDAKIIKELHHLPVPLLDRVSQHTTLPAIEGALILRKLRKRASKVGSTAPEVEQVEGLDDVSNFYVDLENSLERSDSTPARAIFAPTPYLGKRLRPPPSSLFVAISEPLQIVFARSLSGSATDGFGRKPGAEDVRRFLDPLDTLARTALAHDSEYDQIPEDDFALSSCGDEIDLTLFPLALGPYVIPYPFDGNPSPPYSRQHLDGLHASKDNILAKEIFNDPDVCRSALDCTITPAKLRRTESLLPLELVNRVNVLSALLVSHGTELNNCYSNLVNRKSRTQEKLDHKTKYVKELRLEVTTLDEKLGKSQLTNAKDFTVGLLDELAQTDVKLADYALVVRDLQMELALERSKSQEYKDVAEGLRMEVTRFVGYGVECLVRRLLSSDEFNAALLMLCLLNVSNLLISAEAELNKALDAIPSIQFPFLGKVASVDESPLSEVTQIVREKFVRSPGSVSNVAVAVSGVSNQAPVDQTSDYSPFAGTPNLHTILLNAKNFDLFTCYTSHWFGLQPFGEILNDDYQIFYPSCGLWERFDNVHSPLSEWPGLCIVEVVRVSSGRIPLSMYSCIGVIHVFAVSSNIVFTSAISTDRLLSSSTNTLFVNPSYCTATSFA
ncbi:hypothetical protein Tco_0749506 [Tanacetum coccineum]|uniref:Uncharacterized protein n=1 Tax=Tanacetum coccineum TaxID=301880 RepID=A0ABQ4YYU8_9ASTR